MGNQSINVIGELINNSYGRARNAWKARDASAFAQLAKIQTELGAKYITLNLDGTQMISVKAQEMLDFLPEVVPAIQAATDLPISFDNPAIAFHKEGLKHYDRKRGGQPIINSIAASRENLDEFIQLVGEYDTRVIVMASEYFKEDGASSQCFNPKDAHEITRYFVERLINEAGRTVDDIIVDPGLAPVGADTYGLINIGLDAMKLIHEDSDLDGIHMVVGLSNFAWGTPKEVRHNLERAYLTLGQQYGLDYALANVEKNPVPLDINDPLVAQLQAALEQGRIIGDESQEDAGFRQAEAILELCLIED